MRDDEDRRQNKDELEKLLRSLLPDVTTTAWGGLEGSEDILVGHTGDEAHRYRLVFLEPILRERYPEDGLRKELATNRAFQRDLRESGGRDLVVRDVLIDERGCEVVYEVVDRGDWQAS